MNFFYDGTKREMTTHTQIIKQKQIEDHVNTIGKWIREVEGQNHDDALGFIFKYLHHLNENTKKSMYKHILNITGTDLLDINKKNDLALLFEELVKLL